MVEWMDTVEELNEIGRDFNTLTIEKHYAEELFRDWLIVGWLLVD